MRAFMSDSRYRFAHVYINAVSEHLRGAADEARAILRETEACDADRFAPCALYSRHAVIFQGGLTARSEDGEALAESLAAFVALEIS